VYSRSQKQLNSLKISALSVNSIHQLEKKMNNDHFMLSDNLESNKINVNLSVLIDINVTDNEIHLYVMSTTNLLILFCV